jgi:membrane-associated phospholipid phosphatase
MRHLLILFLFPWISHVYAQNQDSTVHSSNQQLQDNERQSTSRLRLSMKTIAFPLSLITYGAFSQSNNELREFDVRIKNVVRKDADFHSPVDNYMQYAPGLAVYTLNAIGIKGKNNFRDRTMIYLLSNVMMGITVQTIKKITKVARPEGFGTNAFPSGHTATAFAGAEFLLQEYKDISPWYGIAGYAAAATTGILRMYNNKHWFRDVVAGAGFGLLSTKLAYWIYPTIKRTLFKDRAVHTMVMPYYQDRIGGISLVYNFNH